MNKTFALFVCLSLFAPVSAGHVLAQEFHHGGHTFVLRDVRSYSGEGNNRNDWGAVGIPLLRNSYSDYPDGIGEEIRSNPNPRDVSNLVVNQQGQLLPSTAGMSDAVWAWGQFIDHDLDLTDSHPSNGSANIAVLDPNDILYPTIFVNRSNHVIVDGVREQINEITSFLDGSQVYGSDEFRALALRTMKGGRMKTSAGNLLPFNVDGLPNLGDGPDLFLGGDIRSNENVVLSSLHTLFVREHNRLASRIEQLAPGASDEQIYQLARKIVGAEIQSITYNEFLPALLGRFAPSTRARYNPRVNATVATEFSTAFYRVGHTLLSSNLVLGDTGQTLPLRDAFTTPSFLVDDPANVDRLLLGLCRQPCQEIDSFIVEDVRTFLFLPPPFAVGLDLAAINIQRGRDNGLPPYNELRVAYGLPPVRDFDEISSDPNVENALRDAYETVDDVDGWVGGISEDHVRGCNVGPLILRALRDQFTRTRDGDRFFFTRDPDLGRLIVRRVIDLDEVTLGWVIRQNTDSPAPDNMFFVNP
jgi:hypothetical protein